MDVISWLGVYFVKNGLFEKAVLYFQRAAEIEPDQVYGHALTARGADAMNVLQWHSRSGLFDL